MDIRKATLEDLGQIHAIYLHAAEFKHQYDDKSWRDGFSKEGVSWMISQGTTCVAEDEGRIVGVTALEWSDEGWGELDNENAGYIRRLAVAKDWHGKGVATALLDWALNEVRSKNRQYLRLDCATKNESLCKYYENLGFELIEQKQFPDSEVLSSLYQKEAV